MSGGAGQRTTSFAAWPPSAAPEPAFVAGAAGASARRPLPSGYSGRLGYDGAGALHRYGATAAAAGTAAQMVAVGVAAGVRC